MRLLAKHLFDHFLNLRHARRAADQDNLVDVAGLHLGVRQHLLDRTAATLDQRIYQLLEHRPGNLHLQVFWTGSVGRDEGQVDVGRLGRAELFLGLFAGLLQPLQGHGVLAQVDALFLLELVGHVVDQRVVQIVAAKVRVAVGRDDTEHAVGHFQYRDIERPAAEVEDGNFLGLLPIQSVGQRGGRRLVDDPRDLQPGNLAGVLGRLALGIVEVGRHGDHGLVDLMAQIGFGRFLEFSQRDGRDFRRRVFFSIDADFDIILRSADDVIRNDLLLGSHLVVATPHEPLDRGDRPRGIGDGLASGRFADERLVFVGISDHARGQPVAFGIGDDFCVAAFHHGDNRVGGSQVDPDDFFAFCHWKLLCSYCLLPGRTVFAGQFVCFALFGTLSERAQISKDRAGRRSCRNKAP